LKIPGYWGSGEKGKKSKKERSKEGGGKEKKGTGLSPFSMLPEEKMKEYRHTPRS